jgi:hypothetical protein
MWLMVLAAIGFLTVLLVGLEGFQLFSLYDLVNGWIGNADITFWLFMFLSMLIFFASLAALGIGSRRLFGATIAIGITLVIYNMYVTFL